MRFRTRSIMGLSESVCPREGSVSAAVAAGAELGESRLVIRDDQ